MTKWDLFQEFKLGLTFKNNQSNSLYIQTKQKEQKGYKVNIQISMAFW